ncbi:hypothetical protein JX265_002050 [Neoarthrinium moseri]|uniref:Arabinan endo-1,5-alpha-L-arabinosidase n=1 Tax=Neoarthrinium moseri TaxID=1658444 RepID=A0A9Q0ATW1_9PEZI|nr:hypothetical protein JX266_006159 [Neoarthrinium moseri]KAI1880429.1 hypothetical protein JX265_002050 [Neoarthrinium moseri]
MAILKAITLVLSSTAALVASAYPPPEACTGNCIGIDPAAIRRDDGTYFRFNTFGKIRIYKAPSFTGPWTLEGPAIPDGSIIDIPGRNSLWAPEVQKVGNQYIMYYSVSEGGKRLSAIGYATSPNMEAGTWTDHGSTGISTTESSDRNAIDPALIKDPATGKYYMSFGSYWSGIWVVPMNDAATQVAKNAKYTNIGRQPNSDHAWEGSNIIFHGGNYYLFLSAGKSGGFDENNLPPPGGEYKVKVCRSKAITGPYVGPAGKSCMEGNGLVLLGSHDNVYAPGGQGIFDDPDLGTVMYYHYANRSVSYKKDDFQFGWNSLKWVDGWPTF